MSVENCGVLCPNRFGDLLLHLKDLDPGPDQGRFKPADLARDLRRFDVITRHIIQIIADNVNDAAGDSGRHPGAAKSQFRFIPAHARARLKANQSSWKRALINSSSSAIAFPASGPSQRMWSFDP